MIPFPFLIWNTECSGQPVTQYLCGFSGTDSVLVLLAQKGYLLLDGRYWKQGEKEVHQVIKSIKSIKSIEIIKIHKEYTQKQAMGEIFRRQGVREITVDSRITSLASVRRVEEIGLKVKAEEGITQKIREMKEIREIKEIKKAQKIALAAYKKLKPEIVVGVSERYLAARLEFLMKERGADRVAFDTIVASGPHSALPHASVTDRKITASDAIILDFGAQYRGYCSDYTRTILMSDVPEKLREIYAVVTRAQRAALKKAVIGTPLKDIDHAARHVIEQAGYGEYFPHATGHGVGMEVHELPHVSFRSEAILQSGHVITIEPGIYLPGLGGVRLEEMVVVQGPQ